MRTLLSLLLAALLLPMAAAPARAQEMTVALDAVTYTVTWAVYDGRAVEVSILQTPNEPDTALMDAMDFDPQDPESEYMRPHVGRAAHLIGSQCDIEFEFEGDPRGQSDYDYRSMDGYGTIGPEGLGLRSYQYFELPEGVSPDVVDAVITIGVQRTDAYTFEEHDSFTLNLPKEVEPLSEGANIDLVSTHIADFSFAQGPHSLVLDVLHKPAPGVEALSFDLASDDAWVKGQMTIGEDTEATDGILHLQRRYLLERNTSLPETVRLSYRGGGDELLVNLKTGEYIVVSPSEEIKSHALNAVTYTVEWTYYDGYVAEIGLLHTPNEPDTALVEALGYDPEGPLDEFTRDAAEKATHLVGSYFATDFVYEGADGIEARSSSGGGSSLSGLGIASRDFIILPPGVSPASVDAEVTVGVVRTKLNEFDEQDRFTVSIPKDNTPLALGAELDIGGTRIAQLSVSRTPDALVVNIFHEPTPTTWSRSFEVSGEDGGVLQATGTGETGVGASEGYVHFEGWFDQALSPNQPLPDMLRIKYLGGEADELLVDLTTGDIEIVEQPEK